MHALEAVFSNAQKEKGDDLLSDMKIRIPHGQREAPCTRSPSSGPVGACLTSILSCRTTLGNEISVASRPVWRRLGYMFTLTSPPAPCKCSAAVAAEEGRAMVGEMVTNMTWMCHDKLAHALHLAVSSCRCQAAAELCYRDLAGEKGQHCSDMVLVLPQLEMLEVDAVVAQPSAKPCV